MSRRRKILIIVGIALGVAIFIPIIRHYQLRFAVESYIAELKAKGEPMDLAQVIPPPTPPEQNGVPFITNALENLNSVGVVANNPPPAMRMVAPGKAMIGWQQPDIRSSDGTNKWEDLGPELAAAKNGLDSFQSLTNHPILDFNLDYQKGYDLPIPHLGSLKRSAQWLSASVIYNLHQGNTANACADVRAMLAIAKGDTDERLIISQLVRIAIAAIGASATWEILQNENVPDSELTQLQQDWQSLEFTGPLEQALKFEQVESLQEFEQIRKSSEKFNEVWEGYYYAPETPVKENTTPRSMLISRSLFFRKWDELRWRWFWSFRDELHGLQSFQIVVGATQMAETNQSFQAVQAFALAGLKLNQDFSDGLRNFSAQTASVSYSALRKAIRIETARNAVVTAIALKRYELRHHQLPTSLEELTTEFLPSVPIDGMDGQPLRYRPNADGTFLLYSVGENGVDDGGNPALEKGATSSNYSWQNVHALDWVWPQPATVAEVQYFYDHPPK